MFEIWHDNDFDLAHWLYLNSNLRHSEVLLRQIPKTNSVSDLLGHLSADDDLAILPVLKYETPDIVVIDKSSSRRPEPVLVVEFMTHTPQHDHPLQRFTRLYGAAWLGIPSILVIPEKKEKLERGRKDAYRPVMYRANPLVKHLFLRTMEVTQTPTMLLMWPEVDGYLRYDARHPTSPSATGDIQTLLEIMSMRVAGSSIQEICARIFKDQSKKSGYHRERPAYGLKTGEVVPTKQFLIEHKRAITSEMSLKLMENEETFLYSPKGLKSAAASFRTDPYAGKLCAFDILYCRDDGGVRTKNLVLQANGIPSSHGGIPTLINGKHDAASCPFLANGLTLKDAELHFDDFCPYTHRKQQRIYGEVPDLVLFEDGVSYGPSIW